MKKLVTILLAAVLITPTIKAAELNVKTLTATIENKIVKYSGTTDEGVLAVSCSLFYNDEEIDISSNQVNNNKFEGTFTVSKEDKYTVKCANYEGGKIVEATTEKETTKKENPKTGDNVLTYITVLTISAAGLMINKKRELGN